MEEGTKAMIIVGIIAVLAAVFVISGIVESGGNDYAPITSNHVGGDGYGGEVDLSGYNG